jgi:hypothetical protein
MRLVARIYGFQLVLIAVLTGLVSFSAFSQKKDSLSGPVTQLGKNDTILTAGIMYQGEFIPYKMMSDAYVFGKLTGARLEAYRAWTRLRNAVYVTYPYARRASLIMNDINAHLASITDQGKRRAYIRSREKELKKEFAEPLMELSIYQGKVLMKLINRETGNNCYEIVKEYKGGVSANFWQTVAWVFGSSLKQPYDPSGDDQAMEVIVLEVKRMYGI